MEPGPGFAERALAPCAGWELGHAAAQAPVLCGVGLASGRFAGAAEGQGLVQAAGQRPKAETMTQLVDAALLEHWAWARWRQRAGTAGLRSSAYAGMVEGGLPLVLAQELEMALLPSSRRWWSILRRTAA